MIEPLEITDLELVEAPGVQFDREIHGDITGLEPAEAPGVQSDGDTEREITDVQSDEEIDEELDGEIDEDIDEDIDDELDEEPDEDGAEGLFMRLADKDPVTRTRLRTLPDTYAAKRFLNLLAHPSPLVRRLSLPSYHVVVFSGPPGNGKHTAADALVEEVAAASHYSASQILYTRLRAEDFPTGQTETEAMGFLSQLLVVAKARPDDRYVILVLDQMESYPHPQVVCNTLAEFKTARGFFVICITTDEGVLNADLLSMAALVRFPAPDAAARRACLEDCFSKKLLFYDEQGAAEEKTLSIQPDGISLDEMVERTGGYSYAELQRFAYALTILALGPNPDVQQAVIPGHILREEVEQCLVMSRPLVAHLEGAYAMPAMQPAAEPLRAESVDTVLQAGMDRAKELAFKQSMNYEEFSEMLHIEI